MSSRPGYSLCICCKGELRFWLCSSRTSDITCASSKRARRHGLAAGFENLRKGDIMNVARSFANWRKYRKTVAELDRMTTRELQDLGIDRSEIRNVARAVIGR